MANHESLLIAAHLAILTMTTTVQNESASVPQTLSAKSPHAAIKLWLQLDVDPALCSVTQPLYSICAGTVLNQ